MQAVEIAIKYLEANKVLRQLTKEKYEPSIKPYCQALRQRMKDHSENEVEASLRMLKEVEVVVPDSSDRGIAQLYILSAAYDISNGATL